MSAEEMQVRVERELEKLLERARELSELLNAVQSFLEDTARYGSVAERDEVLAKVRDFARWLRGKAPLADALAGELRELALKLEEPEEPEERERRLVEQALSQLVGVTALSGDEVARRLASELRALGVDAREVEVECWDERDFALDVTICTGRAVYRCTIQLECRVLAWKLDEVDELDEEEGEW